MSDEGRQEFIRRAIRPSGPTVQDVLIEDERRKAKLDAARQRLAALTDPLARAILDLHSEDERGECQGDDFDGYEAERPSWPCRTVEAVAEQNGIEL
jgi:hypothetical protein